MDGAIGDPKGGGIGGGAGGECLQGCGHGGRALARRRRITDAARKLFAENGFHATGIAQIAKESGVAVGQIYRDFASKEQIIAGIAATDCAAFTPGDTLKDAVARHDVDRARHWIRGFVFPPDTSDSRRLFAEIVAESSRNERIAEIFRAVQVEAREKLLLALGVIAPGGARAVMREAGADIIMTITFGFLHFRLMDDDLASDRLAQSLFRIIDAELDRLAAASA